jgi:type IV pilus assembly protein PilN
LIRINLLTEVRQAAARKKAPVMPTGAKLKNLLFYGAMALGALYIGIMALLLTSERRRLDEQIAKDRIEAERLRSIIEEVQGFETKKADLEAKIKLINTLKTGQKGPVRLMDEISKALPDLVWLSSLDLANNQITLRGRTMSPNAVATYLENIKKSPYFAEPVFRNLGREQGAQGIYSWEMTVNFTPERVLAGPGATGAAPAATTPGAPAGT